MLWDGLRCVTGRGKSTDGSRRVSSLPSPSVTWPFSKSCLHLPSSHAELHAYWRHWATAWLKSILKQGFLLQLPYKNIAFTGTEVSQQSPRSVSLALITVFLKLFFFLLCLFIFVGLELCISLLLILMWRMLSLSKIHSFGQVLYGHWSSAAYTVACAHTKRYVQLHMRDDHVVISTVCVITFGLCVIQKKIHNYCNMIEKFAFSNSQLLLLHTLSSNWRSSQNQVRPRFPWSKNKGEKKSFSFSISERSKKGWTDRSGGEGKSTPAQQKLLR